MNPSAFFAYPSNPSTCGESIATFIRTLREKAILGITPWTECRIGGRVVIQTICERINALPLFFADLTGANPNVMFELGYAIASNKRVWLILDESYLEAKRRFEELRILTTIGYRAYSNSDDLFKHFHTDRPDLSQNHTLFKDAIEPYLGDRAPVGLFYLKPRLRDETYTHVDKRLRSFHSIIIDDPLEAGVQSLSHYAREVWRCQGVLCQLTNPARSGSSQDTPRQAFVAGLAYGFGKELLILADKSFMIPIDYRDLAVPYNNASDAMKALEDWIAPIEQNVLDVSRVREDHVRVQALAAGLKSLQLGTYIAENDSRLLDACFIETRAYRSAFEGTQSLFVGRKGTGKTANLMRLESELNRDRRNLVCVVKPASYEFEGLLHVMRALSTKSDRLHAFEAFWKYLLYTEIAGTVVSRLRHRDDASLLPLEHDFLAFVREPELRVDLPFATRLEECLAHLNAQIQDDLRLGKEEHKTTISEALHEKTIPVLLGRLLAVMGDFRHIYILIDNLDKGWDRQADLPLLSEILLGLLGASSRVKSEISRGQRNLPGSELRLVLFLRADIFEHVRLVAREPDKLNPAILRWDDLELLARVVEERYSLTTDTPPIELWNKWFCPSVKGIPTREYVLKTVLPRPRDLLYLVNAALEVAINRSHARIEETDLIDAEKRYSQFCFDSILVENGVSVIKLEEILYEFAGSRPIVDRQSVEAVLFKGKVPEDRVDAMIEHLVRLGFFGVEIKGDRWAFLEDLHEYRRDIALAEKYAEQGGSAQRFKVNPAYWAFLGIEE